ncbi:phenazine biosynthesis FMN-dependent oxidase PhzG [Streptomyces kunmingensis]|uniref:Phenazine biosynthesis FMN-dependent oxidase PhzG n=1 Tax=Streptomyces kunmingensis TaxID=68225 RepID=A0ABU6C927_9ACTN|nr:phenazine biosynthesis FMN-dependent oxidase PhzG [Streptomyces kunmingensis]MEB3961222.1 phenazine biosynthesis FMN-dependent oxidase PhzG [Streptomyces kunmingensis]
MSDNGTALATRATRSETLTGTVAVPFPEFIAPPAEPMGLLSAWLEDAVANGVREPRALALATADARGRASSRTVAISKVTDGGIVFITHSDSRKGRELAENPWASGVLYWRETTQQITFAGPVGRLSDTEAESLWHARAVFTHAMTAASRQSAPLEDLGHFARLRARALELGEPQRPLPCPATFVGYRLEPDTIEFWGNGTDRLHERLVYERSGDGWEISRLQP